MFIMTQLIVIIIYFINMLYLYVIFYILIFINVCNKIWYNYNTYIIIIHYKIMRDTKNTSITNIIIEL